MNANSKEFKPSWMPAEGSSVSDTPPAPPAGENEAVADGNARSEGQKNESEDDEIDENDPLWKACMKICNGVREEAVKMLEDPDALMSHPEVIKFLDSAEGQGVGEGEQEEWEKSADGVVPTEKPSAGASDAVKAVPPSVPKVNPKAEAEEVEEIDDAEAADEDPRQHLNLVFIGHVDAGKSTLSGSILYAMGMVDTRTIEKFEREAKQRNRESWFLAFIMDTSEEERAKGKTVEVGRAHFTTDINRYTILDAPGHKNYVPNMIQGCCQADVGVLVISARKGEFETGFEKGGQTREHALLAKTLGIQHLVVVVNKMDDPTVNWSQDRYEECVGKLKPYLKSCGYVIKTEVKFVPISGITGDNLKKEVASATCPWWGGYYKKGQHNTTDATLISLLDNLSIIGRDAKGPLRLPILDRFYDRGCVVMGKVESGTITEGSQVIISPTKRLAKIDSLYIGETKVRTAKPGENVQLRMNMNVEDFQKGYVLCRPDNITPTVKGVKCLISLVDMLEHRPLLSPGYDCVLHVHTVEIEVTVSHLLCVIEGNGKKVKRPYARQGQLCQLVLKISSGLETCVENFEKFPALGRVTLRDEGKTIAIGKVLECLGGQP